MNSEKIIKEYGIEFAIEKISLKITQKLKEYKETKDEKIQKELVELLEDREKIYSNNQETIKKYIKQ